MKNFLKNNWIALTVISFLFITEIFHLAFVDVLFKEKVLDNGSIKVIYYDTPIYYFSLVLRDLVISIILYIFINNSNTLKDKRASKSLIVGVIGWDLVEMYQEFCYIAKIDEKVLYFNDGLWGQLTFICILILLTYYGSVKSK